MRNVKDCYGRSYSLPTCRKGLVSLFMWLIAGIGYVFAQQGSVVVTETENNVNISKVVLEVAGDEIIQDSPSENGNPAPPDAMALIKYLELEDSRRIFATTRLPRVANPNPVICTDQVDPWSIHVVRYNDQNVNHRNPAFLDNLAEVVSTPDLRSYWDIGGQPSIPLGERFVDLIYPEAIVTSGFLLYTERAGNSPTDFIALDRNGDVIEGAKIIEVRGWQWDTGVNHISNIPSQTQWLILFSPMIFESPEPVFGIRIISVDEADGKLVFFVNALTANDDLAERVNSEAGGSEVINVFDNDELNGFPLTPIDVELTLIEGFEHQNITLNPDGSVDVLPNTPPGSYEAVYEIRTSAEEFDQATITVEVIEYKPEAFDDNATLEDSFGQENVLNVLDNDLLNGLPALIEDVILSEVENDTDGYLILNEDGSVDVTPGIPNGAFELIYQICDLEHPEKCDQATVTIYINETRLVAVDDDFGIFNTRRAGLVGNVLLNDLLNGEPVEEGRVFVELVDSGGLIGVVLDENGDLLFPEGLEEGNLELTYDLIETINPENRDRGTITVELVTFQLIAEDDEAITNQNLPVNIQVLANDFIDDGAFALQTLLVTENPTNGTATVNTDGTITYQPNVNFTGQDQFSYRICDEEDELMCDQATVLVTVRPIELTLSKTASESDIPVGGLVSFTIELTNESEFPLEGVIVEDMLPGGLMFLTSDPEPSNSMEWVLPQLLPGESTSIFMEVMALGVGDFVNQVTVTIGDYTDQAQAPPVTVIARPVDLAIQKTSFGLEIYEGNEFPYEITVTNNGNTTAEQILVSDQLPSGVSFVGFESENPEINATVTDGTVNWVIESLEPGQSLRFTIRVLAVSVGAIANTVSMEVGDDQVLLSPDNHSTDNNQIREFFVPNVITPDTKDGRNDSFVINGVQRFASHKLTIMNRNGDHVYESENYQNDWSAEGLNGGSYFYVLETVDSQGNHQRYKGWVQVIK